MATLTVLKFPTTEGAEQALTTLIGLQKQELIKLHDAAIVSWPEGKKGPKTRQALDTTSAGALGGAFWGLLFGLLFFIPLLGAAIGAAMGALSGAFTDIGINDDFIKTVREQVTEGTSALFLMSSDAVVDRIAESFKGTAFEIIATNLPQAEEDKLREIFA